MQPSSFTKGLRRCALPMPFHSIEPRRLYRQIADQIAGLWSAGLPMTELQREPSELERATLSAVNAVAQKYSVPGGVTLLLVGDLAKIEAGVRELNLGEIIILDNEGKLVTKK